MQQKHPVITIDGPSGSGKGTIAKALAKQLGWHYLDSGAVYRILGYLAHQKSIPANDAAAIVRLLSAADIRFDDIPRNGHVAIWLNGQDISHDVRNEQIAAMASKISILQDVRGAVNQFFRQFAKPPGLVTDGRDMGTVVFPEAVLKIYLDANASIRAQRRVKQLNVQGINANLDTILMEILERDKRDASRDVAPLRAAEHAICVDTSDMSIEAVTEYVLKHYQDSLK